MHTYTYTYCTNMVCSFEKMLDWKESLLVMFKRTKCWASLRSAGKLFHSLKEQFTPKSEIQIFPPTCSVICPSRLFWCELHVSFWDIGCRDVSLCSNGMEVDCTWPVVIKAPKKYIWKPQQHFPGAVTRLLKIIQRTCCEQFHVGTIYFLSNYNSITVPRHCHWCCCLRGGSVGGLGREEAGRGSRCGFQQKIPQLSRFPAFLAGTAGSSWPNPPAEWQWRDAVTDQQNNRYLVKVSEDCSYVVWFFFFCPGRYSCSWVLDKLYSMVFFVRKIHKQRIAIVQLARDKSIHEFLWVRLGK